jgi:hypothetical protein
MHIRSIFKTVPVSALFISLSLFVLSGCGSNTSTGAGTATTLSSTSATATACVKAIGTRTPSAARTTTGTLKSINGQTLVVTSQQGKDVTVTYSSSTHFIQEVNVPASSLQEGTPVRVAVTSSGNTYSATSITVVSTTGGTGNGGFPGGGGFPGRGNGTPGAGRGSANNPCRTLSGTPGAPGTTTANFRGITGTVSQVSATQLVITDTSGASYTVSITSQTQVAETKSVTASALSVGQPLTITGTNKQGTIAATNILILLSLPTRRGTPTPTS